MTGSNRGAYTVSEELNSVETEIDKKHSLIKYFVSEELNSVETLFDLVVVQFVIVSFRRT